MKTEDLIGGLVADIETRSPPLGATLVAAVVAGAILSGVLFAAVLGPRPDVAVAMTTPRFLFKFAECAGLATAAGLVVFALMRPAADRRVGRLGLLLIATAVVGSVLVEAVLVPPAEWRLRLVCTNWIHCLMLIPLLAAPALVTLMAVARRGAATEPGRAGAMVGVLDGAIGAFFYAANCTDDSPFFVATWYTLAIGATAAIGAAAGRRLLAW